MQYIVNLWMQLESKAQKIAEQFNAYVANGRVIDKRLQIESVDA